MKRYKLFSKHENPFQIPEKFIKQIQLELIFYQLQRLNGDENFESYKTDKIQ